MSKKTIAILKSYFETGDRPTEQQFADLIDSFIHKDAGVITSNRSFNAETGLVRFEYSDNTFFEFTVPQKAEISFINGLQDALNNRVEKVTGKGLSTLDFTNALNNAITAATQHAANADIHVTPENKTSWDNKVDKEEGKGLSTNDYDAAEAQKVTDATAHVNDGTKHVIAGEKSYWNNKINDYREAEDLTEEMGTVYRFYQNAVIRYDGLFPFTTTASPTIDADPATNWTQVIGAATIAAIDNLLSTSTTDALSANQGRILKGLVDDLIAVVSSDDTTLDEFQEIVNFIKANRDTLESLSIANIGGLQAALDSKVTGYVPSNGDLTQAQRVGDFIYGVIDQYTAEEITLKLIPEIPAGLAVDSVIFFQVGTEYFKRAYDYVRPRWFGAVGDGVTLDEAAIQAAHKYDRIDYEGLNYRVDFRLDLEKNKTLKGENLQINGVYLMNKKIQPFDIFQRPAELVDFPDNVDKSQFWINEDKLLNTSLDVSRYDVAGNSVNNIDLYVDPENGVNSNDGLSEASPVKSIRQAMTLITNGAYSEATVWLKPVLYKYEDNWYTHTPDANISVKVWGKGKATITSHSTDSDSYAWTANGAAWQTSKNSTNSLHFIIDRKYLDSNGFFSELKQVESIAEVQNTPDSWYAESTMLYVRLKDERVPDSKLLYFQPKTVAKFYSNTKTYYVENVNFWGGIRAFEADGDLNGNNGKILFNNCDFAYAQTNGLAANGVDLVIAYKCKAYNNGYDGFNYHSNRYGSPLTSKLCYAVEIECLGIYNGRTDLDNNNGSTAHDGIKIIRFGSIAFRNQGPGIADVDGCQSWLIECRANESKPLISDDSDSGFYLEGEAWLDSCEARDNKYNLITTTQIVKLRNCQIAPAISGADKIAVFEEHDAVTFASDSTTFFFDPNKN